MLEKDYILAADEEEIFLLSSNDKQISSLISSDQLPSILEELSLNGFFRYDAFEIAYPRKIEWFHQRFQEYFAAVRLAEKFKNNEDIKFYLNKDTWKDIIVLAAEVTDQREKFILEVLYGWRGLIGMLESRNHRFILGMQILTTNKSLYDEDFRDKLIRDVQNTMNSSFARSVLLRAEKIISTLSLLVSFLGQLLLLIHRIERIQAIGIWLIGISGDKSVAKRLATFLQHPRNRIRWITAYALRMLKSPDTIDDLIDALDDTDKDVLWWIIRALANINDKKSAKALIALLDHEDSNIRACAAFSLADLTATEALPRLEEVLHDLMNTEMLWWGQTVADVISNAIQTIEKNSVKDS